MELDVDELRKELRYMILLKKLITKYWIVWLALTLCLILILIELYLPHEMKELFPQWRFR